MLQLPTADMQSMFMRAAFAEAEKAVAIGEVPIGAVVVDCKRHEIVAAAHNMTITHRDPTAHAEILAVRAACHIFGAQRIPECDIYVTLEPCPMCSAALSFARIRHVFFGADDIKSGGFVSGPRLVEHPALHHKSTYTGGLMQNESAQLLKDFFKARR